MMTKAKNPGTPVNETLKRSIKRNMRRGVWGSGTKGTFSSRAASKQHRPIGSYSCSGSSASMSGLDLGSVSPNGYSTMANGAWLWHVASDDWFERWVPKPSKDETPIQWVERVGVRHLFYIAAESAPEGVSNDAITSAAVTAINAKFAHLDWI